MTLKNILLFNLCPNEMTDDLIASLHVPVDRKIIKQACELSDVKLPGLGTDRPKTKRGNVKIGKETITWSEWDDWKEYKDFQKTLREKINTDKCYSSPIEWEFYKYKE